MSTARLMAIGGATLCVWVCALIELPTAAQAEPVGATFTYQGQLKRDGVPVSDQCDFQFSLWDDPNSADPGNQVGPTLYFDGGGGNPPPVTVNGGLFSVELGFGSDVFIGDARWLQIAVRCPSGSGSYTPVWPRQELTPAPYALAVVGTAGMVPIGAVIDWWRPDASWPIPDGYHICDGTTIEDSTSPLDGYRLPDLSSKFIMGVTSVGDIGQSGGNSRHSHVVNIDHGHPGAITSYAGAHTHSVDLPAYGGLAAERETDPGGLHNHQWAAYWVDASGQNAWASFNSTGSMEVIYIWNNGINGEGTGIFPLAEGHDNNGYFHEFYTGADGEHSHGYSLNHDHPPVGTSAAGDHAHSFSVAPTGTLEKTTSEVSHLPPYYGLLKIMRIR